MNKLLGEAELALPTEAISRTLASELVGRIRADIIDCKLPPGERLPLPDLSARYESGISPLREALVRLCATGLVVLEDQKGFRVAPVSREDLLDITGVRCEIERLALTRSIEQGDVEWEARVVSAHHKLSRLHFATAESRELSPEWERAHQDFHHALVSASGSRWLLHFRSLLAQQTARYRRLIVSIGMGERDVVKEHAEIAEAALGRDAERACALIATHFARTAAMVLSADEAAKAGPVRRRKAKRPAARKSRRQ
jgi:GntR family transcriptional regulator, carbon starvation induced regulator